MKYRDFEQRNINEILENLFSQDLDPIEHKSHPPDELLVSYLQGRTPKGWTDAETHVRESRSASGVRTWQRNEITSHLLTCMRCQDQLVDLRQELVTTPAQTSWIRRALSALQQQFQPVPRPALVTIAAQFFIIVGLAAWISSQPGMLSNGTSALTAQSANSETADSVELDDLTSLPEPSEAINSMGASTLPPSAGANNRQQILSDIEWIQQTGDIRHFEKLSRFISNDDPQISQAAMNAINDLYSSTHSSLMQAHRQIQNWIDQTNEQSNYLSQFRANSDSDLSDMLFDLGSLAPARDEKQYACQLSIPLSPEQLNLAIYALMPAILSVNGSLKVNPSYYGNQQFWIELPASASNSESILGRIESNPQLPINCKR